MIEHFLVISKQVDDVLAEAANLEQDANRPTVGKEAYHMVDASKFIHAHMIDTHQAAITPNDVLYYLVVLRYSRSLNLNGESDTSEELFDNLNEKYTIEIEEEIIELHRDYLYSLGVASSDWQ